MAGVNASSAGTSRVTACTAPETSTAEVPGLVRAAYQRLLQEVLAREFPKEHSQVKTRMAATEPRAGS